MENSRNKWMSKWTNLDKNQKTKNEEIDKKISHTMPSEKVTADDSMADKAPDSYNERDKL